MAMALPAGLSGTLVQSHPVLPATDVWRMLVVKMVKKRFRFKFRDLHRHLRTGFGSPEHRK